MNDDVVLGKTADPGGQTIPLALSPADARERGYSLLFRGPERSYVDARFSVYLRVWSMTGATLFGVLSAAHSWRRDPLSDPFTVRSHSRMSSGRSS